ncbi:MAG: hypothetical protein DRR08_21405 [Candidatus Parabeggiatoa sp. nov. 2]|nr:MAG: hypothetical protein B6247_17095 [Beggiatoa sp. 4572_84]RKZ56572.1 MAG: hypothetical protein DRR08_21405 [Gammaproteobacteria bacterium]
MTDTHEKRHLNAQPDTERYSIAKPQPSQGLQMPTKDIYQGTAKPVELPKTAPFHWTRTEQRQKRLE